jgi:hypothetical protein
LPIALINPQHHHPPHAESAAFGEQRRAIGVEVGKSRWVWLSISSTAQSR